MYHLNAQLVLAKVAEHHPAACCAEINRGHPPGGQRALRQPQGICGLSLSSARSEEGGGNAGVDGDVQARGVTEIL